MRRPVHLVAPGLMLSLAACVVQPQLVAPPAAGPTPDPASKVRQAASVSRETPLPAGFLATPTPAPAGSLAGQVLAPSGIEAGNAADMVAAGGLNMVAAGSLNYELLALPQPRRRLMAFTQGPIKGAPVQLFDASNQPLGEPVLTADDGRYTIPKVPPGAGPFVVKVGVKSKGQPAVLETIVRPSETTTANVDLVTTVLTAVVVTKAKGKLDAVRSREFRRATSELASVMSDDLLPDIAKPTELLAIYRALVGFTEDLQRNVAILTGEATPPPVAAGSATPGPDGSTPGPDASGSPGTTPQPGGSGSPGASPSAGASTDPSASASPAGTPPPLSGAAAFTGVRLFLGGEFSGFVDGDASAARIKSPAALVFDDKGYLYMADRANTAIRRIDGTGRVTTIAGRNEKGDPVESASGPDARFSDPLDLAVNPADATIYVLDAGHRRIRKVVFTTNEAGNIATSTVTILSGSGVEGFKEGTAKECQYDSPVAIAFDGKNTLFVADVKDSGSAARILKVDATTGDMSLYAGGPKGVVNGKAADARFRKPTALAVRWVGETREVWVADAYAGNIRRIVETPDGPVVSTVVGPTEPDAESFSDARIYGHKDTLPLSRALFRKPYRMAFGPDGDLFIVDYGNSLVRWLRMVDGEPASIRTLAPASVATGGGTSPFKVEGMSAIAVHPTKKTLYLGQGDLARISTID